MAGIDPHIDPRGARWERRLHLPVLVAAWLAIPTVILYFSSLEGATAAVAVTLAWAIWLVFALETAVMLAVVRDRRAWIRGHAFGLAIVLATFPLLTYLLEGLLAARALSSLQGVRVLQVLYLAKAAKIVKSALIVRRTGGRARHPLLMSALWLVGSAAVVGIGHRIVTGEKHETPFHNLWDVVDGVHPLVGALALAAGLGALLVVRRRPRPAAHHQQ
ncbi:MAG TPA: hypothetical protein VNT51_00240, partial [Miltoncostaeaceae bacterium]|nr:hypothetical protein [Miltoncostaeaceae bacterium]